MFQTIDLENLDSVTGGKSWWQKAKDKVKDVAHDVGEKLKDPELWKPHPLGTGRTRLY